MSNLVIAISGLPGAGSTSIAKEIAKRLKLKHFSVGRLHKRYGKIKKESEAALRVLKTKFGKSEHLHKKILDRTQLEKAKKGNIVICGKLSINMLKGLADYKIWIHAPLRVRAARTAKRDKINFKQALREIKEREKIEREMWKEMYGFDYFDQKHSADFVLDNSKLTLEQAVNKILEFIKKGE